MLGHIEPRLEIGALMKTEVHVGKIRWQSEMAPKSQSVTRIMDTIRGEVN